MLRSLRFVRHLPSFGFVPVVVAGPWPRDVDAFPVDSSLEAKLPAGLAVHRTPGPPPAVGRWTKRLDRWLLRRTQFAEWWVRSAGKVAFEVAENVRLVYATMSPFESADLASFVARQLDLPWVADLRDPWALDERTIYPTLVHRLAESKRMGRTLSTASLIIMNTPEAARMIRETFPDLSSTPIVAITNGFDDDDFSSAAPERKDSRFRIVHSGGFSTPKALQLQHNPCSRRLGGVERGVDFLTASPRFLIEAIERCCAAEPVMEGRTEVIFVGQGCSEDRVLVSRSGSSGLYRFAGAVSHDESIALIRSADLLFLAMHNLPTGKRSRMVQAKTYEYMASGQPILAAVPEGDAREFLHHSGNAMLCRPDDLDRMVEILRTVYHQWAAGRVDSSSNRGYLAQYEGRALTETLATHFRTVLSRGLPLRSHSPERVRTT